MKQSKSILFLLAYFAIVNFCNGQTAAKISSTDFKPLIGFWKGSLTYLDYSTGKPYTMPADIEIKRKGKTQTYSFENKFPNEPKANSTDTISISKTGDRINAEIIRSRKKLVSGNLEIITEENGVDGNDNKKAIFRHTYLIGENLFSKKKEVKFDGTNEWIKRHEYTYQKKSL